MATYDATSAQCLVYSYKDGLLSTIAHDLKHRVTRFLITVDEDMGLVEVQIDARSLRVECVMKDGVETNEPLSPAERRKIEAQIMRDVLNAHIHPRIHFYSTGLARCAEGLEVRGVLELNNYCRPLSTVARRVNGHYESDVTILQPEFGIKPFSAMMGTLRIRPEVLVRMRIPAG